MLLALWSGFWEWGGVTPEPPAVRPPGGTTSDGVRQRILEEQRLDQMRQETQESIKQAIDAVKRPKKAKAKAPVEAAAPVATYFKDATPTPIVLAAPLTNPDAIAVNVSDILFRADDEIAIALLL